MPRRPVFTEVMNVVERRIAAGDYMLKDLPGERRLADEVGVSYMTARKAVLKLIEKRVLARKPNGSLVVHPRLSDLRAGPQVALLTPAYPSIHFVHCRLAVSRAAQRHDAQLRPVEFTHWFDPVIKEALEGSEGTLVIPSTEPIPESLLREFADPALKVVFFDADMTEHGIPSIRLFGRDHISTLFEHLWMLGHRRIDCLNAQGHNEEIQRRIAHWRDWLAERGGAGELLDAPAPPYEDPTRHAHETITRLLQQGVAPPRALVCTTQPAALGAIRAFRDARLDVGSDISVCTINNEPTGRYFCPSLTGLELPDIDPLVERCFDWFVKDESQWSGSLRIVPDKPNLFVGESTGQAEAPV